MKKILITIFLIALFALTALFLSADFIAHFEGWVYQSITVHMSPTLTSAVKIITHTGDAMVVTAICLSLFVVPKIRKLYALPVAFTVSIAEILNLILKNVFVRERPNILRLVNETSYSFPSGHAMASAALYSCIAILAWRYNKKIAMTIFCCVMTILIGLSRVYLGVHYITDVIGGWCLGIAIATIVTNTYERITPRP